MRDAAAPAPANRLQRVRELFEAALARTPEERARFVDEACAGDTALRDELGALLAVDAASATGRADPLAASVAAAAADRFEASAPWLGRRVGSYRIVGELGRGGMGSVYLAERADREYDARVAIKVIRGFPTAEALERLRRERQVLAGLVHPNIARLLDGGTTADGQPFLVIEYVDGLPLARWLAARQATLDLRLRVFQQLCHAVHHAHQNLIVHRDLKPANVIVRADDAPVLLDFGIAKLVAADGGGAATELRAFTPDYASPEQLAGAPVTTASDIYGLGLILYELLCGAPYRGDGRSASWRESRPGKRARSAEPAWLRESAPRIDGDLDLVVRRALAPDPAARYASAAALAADIDRYFAGLPLDAGPDRLRYRIGKFVARHRAAVAATGAAALGLVALASWLGVERGRALRAERHAQREAQTANQVTGFLLGLFRDIDPENTRGREVSALELLERGRTRLAGTLSTDPAVRSRVLAALAETYTGIGQPARGAALLDEALGLAREAAVPALELADVLHRACRAHYEQTDYAGARRACSESLALRRAALDADDPEVGRALDLAGLVDQAEGHFADAEGNYRRALVIFERAGPGHRDDLATARHELAFLAAQRGDYETARRGYAAALADKRALYGDAHPLTLNSLNGLAQAEQALGDLAAARTHFEQVLALRIQVQGEASLASGHAHNDLAAILQDLGDWQGAAAHYRAALDTYRRIDLGDGFDYASTSNNLATLEQDRGDLGAARTLFETSVAIRRRKFAPDHPSLARAERNLARCLIELGEPARARGLLDAARAARAALSAQSPERFDGDLIEVEWRFASGDRAGAAAALAVLAPPDGKGNYRRRARLADLGARLAAARGDAALARTAAQQALDELRGALAPDHPLVALASVRLARFEADAGDAAGARRLLAPALAVIDRALVEAAPGRVAAHALAERLERR